MPHEDSAWTIGLSGIGPRFQMFPAVTDIRATRSKSLTTGVSYTMLFIAPQTTKSIGDKSGDLGGPKTGPSLPMQLI